MRTIIAAITCVLAISLLGGCSSRTTNPSAPTAPKVAAALVTSLTPRPGVRYYQPGVHAAGETSVGVGILRYRSLSATRGEWLLTSYQGNALLAANARPLAVLAVEPRFEAGLHRLDGQYVAVEGPVVSAPGGVSRIGATALCQVSDMFPRDTNVISKPGFYNHPMGMNVVIGWMGETTGGVTPLYDRSRDSTQAPRAIARVMGAQRPDPRDRVMDAEVFVIENGPVPLVEAVGGSSYEPHFRTTEVGSPPEWYRIERAGIKDLSGGRVRVVGTYVPRDSPSRDGILPVISVGDVAPLGTRLPSAPSSFVYLDDPNGLVPKTIDAENSYVGAEGKLTETGDGYQLAIDRAQTIPFPRSAIPGGDHPANIRVAGDARFLDRSTFDSLNFGRLTTHDLEMRYGITLSFPSKAAGGDYQGILKQDDSGGTADYSAIYSNDTMVDIHVFTSIHDAKGWIGGDGTSGSLTAYSYIATRTIGGGAIAYATPKLTRASIIDADGRLGLESTGNAKVTWRRGRFVISAASPDGSVDDLLGVARAVTFEPTSTAK